MRRASVVAAVALVVAAVATYVLRPERGVPAGAPTLEAMARAIGGDVMRHLHRGHVPWRSAEVMLVPKPHHYIIGRWDLTTLGTARPTLATSHPNPWAYLARVPLILYGPGLVDPARIDRPVDIAGLGATYASMLGIEAPMDAEPLVDVPRRPKVVLTVVIDGGGWNVLRQHPHAWPVIAGLARRGADFTNATIGSAPSITGALHANIGTGSYPAAHGIPGNQMRDPQGNNVDTYLQDADPRFLRLPTVSDLWDERNGNRPNVATIAYEGWHLGMMGHGAQRDGGDRDIAVLWEIDEQRWWVNEDYYELPSYLLPTDRARLERYERALDGRDAASDGAWFGHAIDELRDPKLRPGTPAFVRFTGDAAVEVVRREPVGADALTDLVWVEMKMPDFAGHLWNMLGPEEEDVLRATDRQIGRLVAELERTTGPGELLVAITADHGQQPLPDLYGGWRINNDELLADLERRFGDVVEKVSPVDVYVDVDALERAGFSLADIARYAGTYTLGDNIPEDGPGADLVPEGRGDDLLFAGAFTTGYLTNLTESDIARFGRGDYAEGDLRSPPSGP